MAEQKRTDIDWEDLRFFAALARHAVDDEAAVRFRIGPGAGDIACYLGVAVHRHTVIEISQRARAQNETIGDEYLLQAPFPPLHVRCRGRNRSSARRRRPSW